MLPASPDSSLYVAELISKEIETPLPVVPHAWLVVVNTSEFAGKSSNEIVSCRLLFLYYFEFALGFLYFPRGFFGIEDLLYDYYTLPFELSRKTLPVILPLLFF